MLDQKRDRFKGLEHILGKTFSKLGLSPNHYTLLSIVAITVSFYFLAKLNLIFALIFSLFAGFLDLIDGAVARSTGTATKKGAYLDTICDRYVEAIILLGFLFLPLPYVILPSEIWILLSLTGSLMTTYSKAAAKEKELVVEELRGGLFSRAERMVCLSLSLILGIFNFSLMIYPLIILAIFSNLTALQRIYLSLNPSKN